MQKVFMFVTAVLLLGTANSLFAADQSAKIKKLQQRVEKLEKEIAPLLAKYKAEQNVLKQRVKATKKMQEDWKSYSRKQLQEIETLYQAKGHKLGSPEKTKSLEQVIAKYPKSNRAGCAILYLGQTSKGEKQKDYLKQAIKKYGDCFYGDGTQVGPYARLILASVYSRSGKKAEAAALVKEIEDKFPDAIDHRGYNLASIAKMIKL